MKNHVFNYSTKIISGNGSIRLVGKEIKQLGIDKVMIVTDFFISNSLIMDEVIHSLNEVDVDYYIFDEVKSNPRDITCLLGVETAKKENIQGVVAIGGGSSMDQGKAIAALLTNGGTCQDWDGKPLKQPMLPTICVPTTAGTGSEVTYVAVITDSKRKFKMSLIDSKRLVPSVAVIDPELTISLPPLLTASTGMDALTHAIEAYTCTVSQPITDALALHVIEVIGKHLVNAVRNGSDIKTREAMLSASTMAGIAFINSNVGAVHAISETIGALFDTPHGIANSIFLPYVMKYNIPDHEHKFAEIARRLGIESQDASNLILANMAVKKVNELSHRVGIPNFKDLDYIRKDDFNKIAELSAENELSLDNARKISKEGYLEILELAYNNMLE